MSKKNIIVTIGREFGSGGREIGEKLAEKLNINFYDKNLIELAAKRSGLDVSSVAHTDEKAPGLFVSGYTPTVADQLFFAQSDLIRSLADNESFVIVGRCANSILYGYADTVDAFIYAPLTDRIERIRKRYMLDSNDKAKKEIIRVDKIRRTYYQYYSEFKWGSKEGFDCMLNSSLLGVDGTVEMLYEIVKKNYGLTE